jgi:hypothetical protein
MTTRPEQDVKAETDLATHAAKTPSQAHAADATLEKVANKGQAGGYAGLDANARLTSAVERLLPAPSGSDDLAAINAVLAAGGFVRGRPDQTYLISGPLVVPSNTRLDMKRCTVQFVNTSVADEHAPERGGNAGGYGYGRHDNARDGSRRERNARSGSAA